MAQRPRQASNSRGTVAGWILLLLLLTAIMLGAFAVLEAAASWESKVRTNAAERQASLSVPAPSPSELEAANTPAAPEEPEAPAAEEPEAPAAEEPVSPTEAVQPDTEPEEPDVPEEPETARVTLMALGDNLIHNCVYWSAQKNDGTYDFTPFYADIQPTVESYDIACINQETILVKDRNLIESYPVFGSPIEVADALADAGFNVVTFASNHCYDKRETGITDTLSYFHETYPEITTLGIHDTEADAAAIPIVEKNGIRIAMLNFTYGLNNSMPEKRWMVDTLSSRETVCGRIEQAKQEADFVIVFPHWGTEDTFSPDNDQLTWAQEMADAGADLIIGGHTHTLQPVELLTAADGRDVPVYYSLGNFLSHQKEKMNLLGGMASVTIVKDADGTHVSEYDLQPTVNVILRNANTGWYTYRPMLLDSYNSDLAAQNRFSECTVDAMWALYEDITG